MKIERRRRNQTTEHSVDDLALFKPTPSKKPTPNPTSSLESSYDGGKRVRGSLFSYKPQGQDFLNEGATVSYADEIIDELSAPNTPAPNLSDSGIDFSSHELPDENSEMQECFNIGRTEFSGPRYINQDEMVISGPLVTK